MPSLLTSTTVPPLSTAGTRGAECLYSSLSSISHTSNDVIEETSHLADDSASKLSLLVGLSWRSPSKR